MGFLENALQNLAMVDYPYPTDFLKQLPAWPVQVTCDRFQQMGGDVVSGLSNAIRLWYNDTGLATCFNITDQSEGQVRLPPPLSSQTRPERSCVLIFFGGSRGNSPVVPSMCVYVCVCVMIVGGRSSMGLPIVHGAGAALRFQRQDRYVPRGTLQPRLLHRLLSEDVGGDAAL